MIFPVNVSFVSKGSRDTHRLRTPALKRKEPKTGTTGCRKKGQRGHSQTVGLFWIPILTGLSSQFFLGGKGQTFNCQDLGMNKKNRGYWEEYKWPPKPLPCAAVAASTSECEHSVESLTCVYHEYLLIQRGLWIWKKILVERRWWNHTDLLSKWNIKNSTGLQQTKHTYGLGLAHSEK